MIKVDIRKAFDSVQWTFIRSMILCLNFPEQFTNWIMGCISTTWFTLRINVSFHPKCARLSLTHLIFDDDLMVFVRGDVPSAMVVALTLEAFSKVSGLFANGDKTNIYFGGMTDAVKKDIMSQT
ncbi:uncharacterized protein LOC141640689 [Silene latifolia]|uniref:uncharacterized protein LOC141640689 n=1 Tax=Silene latifolia TaxID=37657 RepID=UPI003D76DEA6